MLTGKVGVAPGTTTLWNPYSSIPDLKGLGIIPSPRYANRSLGPGGDGNANFIPAFPGMKPNDFELARMRQTQMVDAGWYNSMNGLGLIDPNDQWMTGRRYGLPGTVAVRVNAAGGNPQLQGNGISGLGIYRVENNYPYPSNNLGDYESKRYTYGTFVIGAAPYVLTAGIALAGSLVGSRISKKGKTAGATIGALIGVAASNWLLFGRF
jgi:hypothetical protein